MFALMVARSFVKNRQRKVLAVVTIALGASLAAAMLSLALDVGDKVARELRSYGANLSVKPKTEKIISSQVALDYDPLAAASYLNQADLLKIKMIFWRNNILAFAPFLYSQGRVDDTDAPVIGAWFDKKIVLDTGQTIRTGIRKTKPWVKVKGRWPDEETAGAAVLVGSKLAKSLDLRVGNDFTLALAGKTYRKRVSGVISGGADIETSVYLPLAQLQQALGLPGKFNEAEVSALTTPENALARKYQADQDSLTGSEWEKWYCSPYVDAIAYQIEEVIPASTAAPVRRIAQSESAVLSKIQLLISLLTVAALASSALAVSGLMTAIVLERSREVGLAKALGAPDSVVVAVFLTEAGLLGLAGGIAGYGGGVVFAQFVAATVFGTAIEIKPVVLPLTLMISLFITLGGCLAAVRTIIKLSPKEVLHG